MPVRSLLLGWRVLPRRLRPWLRCAGPYGRAAVDVGIGRPEGGAGAAGHLAPKRLAAFALAVDRPDAARSALDRMPAADPARAVLLARLAIREGRLTARWPSWTVCRDAGRPKCVPRPPVSCPC